MSNIEIEAQFIDGSMMTYHPRGESCRRAVEFIIGDDHGAPPRGLNLTVHTVSGKTVQLILPNDNAGVARVLVDGEAV